MRYKLLEESLVYIISVNFNAAEHTIEMINSLKDIEYKNYRIVVVDNGSNDGSGEELVKIYSNNNHCHILLYKKNSL